MTRTVTVYLAFLIVGAAAGTVFAAPAADDQIRERLVAFEEAWASKDAPGMASYFTPDATWTNALGETVKGADAIAAMFLSLIEGPLNGARILLEAVDLRYPAPDVCVELERWTLEGLPEEMGGTLSGNDLVVWTRDDEGWRILAGQAQVPAAPPPPPVE